MHYAKQQHDDDDYSMIYRSPYEQDYDEHEISHRQNDLSKKRSTD
jgi:hypothetical protein